MFFKDTEIFTVQHALDEYGDLWAWGNNLHHALGFEDQNKIIPEKRKMYVSDNVKKFNYGYSHTVYLCDDGRLYGLGSNKYGQIGVGPQEYKTGGTLIDTDVDDFVCGPVMTLYVKNGKINFLGRMFTSKRDSFVLETGVVNDIITPYTNFDFIVVGDSFIIYQLTSKIDGKTELFIHGDWARYNLPGVTINDNSTYFGTLDIGRNKIRKIVPTKDNIFMLVEVYDNDGNFKETRLLLYGKKQQFDKVHQGKLGLIVDKNVDDIFLSKDEREFMSLKGNTTYKRPLSGYEGVRYDF